MSHHIRRHHLFRFSRWDLLQGRKLSYSIFQRWGLSLEGTSAYLLLVLALIVISEQKYIVPSPKPKYRISGPSFIATRYIHK